jgi:hypothetical protein
MKFIEISKPLVTQILSESLLNEAEGKNTHLEHLEDNIFNKGYAGAKEAIDYLYSLHQMLEGHSKNPINITTKWDGKPAIICGRDPQSGKFFVGTKGVFAQKPKLNFTPKDILENHGPGELADKLTLALKLLSKLNWNTVAQGDMLWAGKDQFKEAKIGDENYIVITPNTLTYAIPVGSDLANEMSSKTFGIVFHTEYTGGPTLADTQAKFGFDSSVLGEAPNVWHTDARIKDVSGTVTLTADENKNILSAIAQADNYLKSIDKDTFNFLDKGADIIGDKIFLQQLKAHVNANIKNAGEFEQNPTVFAQSFVQKYIAYMQKEIEKVKTQKSIDAKTEKMVQGVKFIKEHVPSIVAVYDLYLKLIEAKLVFIEKLKAIQSIPTFVASDNGYEVAKEEGFVAVDRMGNAIKLVDRLEFSKNNFAMGHGATK